jgi:hypothetical protein
MVLQIADQAAHGRLGDVDQPGGRADAAGQHDSAEGLDLSGVEGAHDAS